MCIYIIYMYIHMYIHIYMLLITYDRTLAVRFHDPRALAVRFHDPRAQGRVLDPRPWKVRP